MRSTLCNDILEKVLTLVLLVETGSEVYVATMTTIIYDSYYSLVDTLNHTKNLKFKDHPGRYAADFYDAILVNLQILESYGAFNPKHLGYIINIFENTSNSRFQLWATQKYKEVMEFVKKPLFFDEDVMHTHDIINYGFLAQEYMREYSSIVNSKRWEPTDIKSISKDEYLFLTDSTVEIKSPVNKTADNLFLESATTGNTINLEQNLILSQI